ncbi:RNA polymerase sigma-54 factor, partial [uncultured Bacteroides sp.]
MAQGSRQIQSQAQQQVQTLSPQQILVVKLLELPAVELEDRIHAELLENPALEEGREENAVDEYADADSAEDDAEGDANDYDSLSDYLNEDDIPDYKLQENNRSKDERAEDIPFSDTTSFYEILKEQLRERNLTEHQSELVEYLIGSLDDDGLLRKSLESICDELAIYAGIDAAEEELEEALLVLQDFDPAGLGARTLQECLLIQIRRKKEEEKTPAPILDLEERVIRDYYEEFTRKHWEKIIKKLDIGEETFKEVIGEITRLNPRPGSSLGEAIGRNLQQIIPDFIVETYDDGTIQVSLNNRHVPELRMSRDFTEMVEEHTRNKANQSKESKEAMMFLKQKMDAAQGFIDAVRQRQNTLMTTMQAIVELQRPFFLEGDESLLKPMILKDV